MNERIHSTSTVAHITLWPPASALYLYNAVAAAVFSPDYMGGAFTYQLKSPD